MKSRLRSDISIYIAGIVKFVGILDENITAPDTYVGIKTDDHSKSDFFVFLLLIDKTFVPQCMSNALQYMFPIEKWNVLCLLPMLTKTPESFWEAHVSPILIKWTKAPHIFLETWYKRWRVINLVGIEAGWFQVYINVVLSRVSDFSVWNQTVQLWLTFWKSISVSSIIHHCIRVHNIIILDIKAFLCMFSVGSTHNGVFQGKRYFHCPRGHGIMAKYAEVIRINPPEKCPPITGNPMFPSYDRVRRQRLERSIRWVIVYMVVVWFTFVSAVSIKSKPATSGIDLYYKLSNLLMCNLQTVSVSNVVNMEVYTVCFEVKD